MVSDCGMVPVNCQIFFFKETALFQIISKEDYSSGSVQPSGAPDYLTPSAKDDKYFKDSPFKIVKKKYREQISAKTINSFSK